MGATHAAYVGLAIGIILILAVGYWAWRVCRSAETYIPAEHEDGELKYDKELKVLRMWYRGRWIPFEGGNIIGGSNEETNPGAV